MKTLTRYILRYNVLFVVLAILVIIIFSKLLGEIRFFPVLREIQEIRCRNNENFYEGEVNDHWLAVADRKTVAYSAFLDLRRDQSVVRILTIGHLFERRPILCLLWTRDQEDHTTWKITVTESRRVLINDINPCLWIKFCTDYDYESYYLNCDLAETLSVKPKVTKYSVSLIAQESYNELLTCSDYLHMPKLSVNFVYDRNNDNDFRVRSSSSLAVCVGPVFDWDRVTLTKLFLEHYLSQGFTKFVFYKRSWSSNIENIFSSERYKKYIRIIRWPLMPNVSYANLNDDTIVHYRGQILAINDCLWRQRMDNSIRFVAFVDMDEFLSPGCIFSDQLTLNNVLSDYDRPDIGSFAVENRYFIYDLKNLHNGEVHMDERQFAYPVRSKIIVKPNAVEKLGIHKVWRLAAGYRNQILSSDVVTMNHYKPSFENGERPIIKTPSKTLHQIFPKLIERFEYIFNNSET